MFSRFSRKMFNVRGNHNNNNNNDGGEERRQGASSSGVNSAAPSPKKSCNRESDTDNQRDSKSQSCEVDNSIALISKIAALYAERLLSDLTIVINGLEYPAHRLILCASSDVFQVMLMNKNWTESQKSRIVLQESPECAKTFEDFLKYLYTGSLKLTLENVMHLLILADKYNVKDLINLCLNYMTTHIPSAANHSQLIQWFQYTCNCGHNNVANKCRDFIKWNFDLVSKSEDFHHLDLELLTSILLDDDIVIYDEFSLFSCIDQWINCQRNKIPLDDNDVEERMLQIVQESMECVRFPMMSPRQLADLLLFPLTQKYKDYLMGKMAIGMAFHSGVFVDHVIDLVSSHPHQSKLFTPRLYMTDKWSVCMTIDNFSRMDHFQSKTLVFSTPVSFAEKSLERQIEWVVDFYPKGVCYHKHYLIIWQGMLEVPEIVMKTVRLSVLCKSEEEIDVRVKIGVLITGSQDGVECVVKCVKRSYIFSKSDRILNFDDLLPYEALTQCANCKVTRQNLQADSGHNPSTTFSNIDTFGNSPSSSSSCLNRNICCGSTNGNNCLFIGKNLDTLKIKIVITPKNNFIL